MGGMVRMAVVALALLAAGCVHRYDPATVAMMQLDEAEEQVRQGNYLRAYGTLTNALDLWSGVPASQKAQALAEAYPKFGPAVERDLRAGATRFVFPPQATSLAKKLAHAVRANLITEDARREILAVAEATAMAGNESGALPFTFLDEIDLLPALKRPEEQRLILRRSLDLLLSEPRVNTTLLHRVVRAAGTTGPGSPEYEQVLAALPRMRLSKSVLQNAVSPVFPDYAAAAIEAMTVRVHLNGNDRLIREDVGAVLRRRMDTLEIVPQPVEGAVVITLDTLRWDEREDPERTRTIRYDADDVRRPYGEPEIPEDSWFVHEHTTGRATLEYAIEMKAVSNGSLVADTLVRDLIAQPYGFCSNARIQDVSGAARPVDFVANYEMEKLCEAGVRHPVYARDLRGSAIEAIAHEILALPALSR